MFALVLAPVQPRQGRYAKLLPSLLIYACSIVLLIALQQQVGKNKLDVAYCGILIAAYIGGAMLMISQGRWRAILRLRKPQ
jgi:lipopolysaccharide export system permease protein